MTAVSRKKRGAIHNIQEKLTCLEQLQFLGEIYGVRAAPHGGAARGHDTAAKGQP